MTSIDPIDNVLNNVPDNLKTRVLGAIEMFNAHCTEQHRCYEQNNAFWKQMTSAWAASRFITTWCANNGEEFCDLLESDELMADDLRDHFKEILEEKIADISDKEQLMKILRGFRNRQMVRIAFRDINGLAALNDVMLDVTAVAEAVLAVAHDFLYRQLSAQKGVPVLTDGRAQRLVILGMGKLGAWELNFSSDIDLIFAYTEEGALSDRNETTYGEFFTRLARDLISVLDTITQDGFVFRVDMRLRPFGESGPLVMSLNAMESYYQQQARGWERYAMIKARVVAGDFEEGQKFESMLQPFVYRRYLDYGVFAGLRQLKTKISKELQRKDRMDNIKLGPGGIREIEFIGQAFQLLRGGREKSLQERRILQVLSILGDHSLMPPQWVDKLTTAYVFLRMVENRLQQYDDKQVHDLPKDEEARNALLFALGYDRWLELTQKLDATRKFVHSVFEQVFESPQAMKGETAADITWQSHEYTSELQAYLASLGYQYTENIFNLISSFRGSYRIKALSSEGAAILDRLIPMLVVAACAVSNRDEVLARILTLIEAIARRQAYLNLLVENPLVLSQLVKLASASPWITSYITKVPLLLDELLDPRELYSPRSKTELDRELRRRLSTPNLDWEQQLYELRHFKQSQVLRVAAADIIDAIPLMVVSDYLTNIAEVTLNQVVVVAWRKLAEKHGVPVGASSDRVSGFAIIGYGKLGGIELGYGSDLDLVFIYDAGTEAMLTDGPKPLTHGQFFTRLGQRVVNMLSANMVSGVLYEVDMRLRPSGNSGLLVSSINAFKEYQHHSAWTWEHQALIRARFVAGDEQIAQRFSQIRRAVLCGIRDTGILRSDVRDMREKMRENLAIRDGGKFDLKQGVGGIVDIEFLVQYLILEYANSHPDLVDYTDNIRLLDGLQSAAILPVDDASFLRSAYCRYRDIAHAQALQERKAVVDDDLLLEVRERVIKIWRATFKK